MIYEKKNTLDKEVCDGMISWYENKVSTGNTKKNYTNTSKFGRKDSSISLCQQFDSFKPFYNKINSIIHEHVERYFKKWRIEGNTNNYNITGYKLQKSTKGGGFTTWHSELDIFRLSPIDFFKSCRRFGVWMVYLNNTDSGYTDFMHQKLSVKPETGKLVIWPAYFTHTHRANPDLKEDKYIITGWLESNYGERR
tara:strand:- start:151 stop:735 length:585 start_codon:yes stop_codon:yes gene_type:complete